MSCLSVLRFGPFPDDNDCARHLRTALLQHFNNNNNKGESNDQKPQQISISNRYFTAQVLLGQIEDDDKQQQQQKQQQSDVTALAEDGIVLVFDALLSNPTLPTSITASFDAMEVVHDRAVATERAGDLLRLCVGVGKQQLDKTISEKEYEAEYSRRVLWCLDRGYEYVEADLTGDLTTGHDVRDKEGFARVVEAIAGTVWSSAVMRERRQAAQQPLEQANSTTATTNKTIDRSEKEETNEYEPPDPEKLPPVPGSEKLDEEREEMARQALLADTEKEVSSKYLDDPEKKIVAKTIQNRREEMEQERALDALEGTLREARMLRELSQSGALSDDERRKRAGDAAMLLMDMMGKFDVDEDDDDGSLDECSDNNSLVEKEEKTAD